jgi:hypothetical protein
MGARADTGREMRQQADFLWSLSLDRKAFDRGPQYGGLTRHEILVVSRSVPKRLK